MSDATKFCVIGKTAGRTVSKNKRKFFDTQAEATAHGEKIIADRYRENPGQPHITLYVAQLIEVLEVGAPVIAKRAPNTTDGATEDDDED